MYGDVSSGVINVYHSPGTDICITFKSPLMRGRFKTSRDEAKVLLYNLFEGVTSLPELPDLFCASNPPKQVWFSVIEWFSELSSCALADSRSFVG